MSIDHRNFLRRTALGLAVAAIACTGSGRETGAADVDAAGAWRLDPTPSLDVGDREDGDTAVFGVVLDARLLPGGLLAVADGGAFAVRFIDAEGRFVRSVGRRGRGPAEFNGQIQLMDAPGDSVAVWDPGQARWTLVSSTNGGTRQLIAPLPVPVWVHAGIEIHSALAAPPAWVPTRLASLAASQAGLRLAHLDETGVLWVRSEPVSGEWRAYVDTSATVGGITLPAGERLLHVTRDAVVALASDSLGLERVLVHALSRGAHVEPALTPTAVTPVDSAARNLLMVAMRRAVMAQEMNYAERSSYTSAADSLNLEMPPGTALRIIESTNRGWRGVGYFTTNGYSCGMIVGLATPAGWTEGEVRCGW